MWCLFCCTASFAPFLPLYFRKLGLSPSETAVLLAMPALAGLLSAQWWGYLADMRMTRRRVIAIQSLCGAGFALAYPHVPGRLEYLAPMLFAHSLFVFARVSTLNSLILASGGGEDAYGRIRVAGSAGFGIMALVLGGVIDRVPAGVSIIWPTLFCFEMVAAASCAFLRDTHPSQRSRRATRIGFRQAQRILLSSRPLVAFLVFSFFTQLTLFPGQYMQVRYLGELGASTFANMGAFALGVVAETIVFIAGQRIILRAPILVPMFLGAASIGMRWLLVWAFPSVVPILLTNVLHMFSFGVAYLAAVFFIQQHSPPELRSSAQTMLALAYFSLPNLLGSLLSAALLEFLTLHQFYGVCGLLGCAALVTILPLRAALRAHRA